MSFILAEPWESMKLMPAQSSTIPVRSGRRVDDLAEPVLQRVGGGEEQAAVHPDHDDAGDLLVVRDARSSSRNTWVPARAPSIGMWGWVATAMSQRSERPIPIMTPASTPNDQGAEDRGDRDPEVEPLDARKPPHLGDVHHAHHDGLDDECGQHRLGQVGEQRGQERGASAAR